MTSRPMTKTFLHDLTNRLTVLTLHLHEANHYQRTGESRATAQHIDEAIKALERLNAFIDQSSATK